jgi:4'-phosphopantetheinyl transferase
MDELPKIDFWSFSLDCDDGLLSQAESRLTREERERVGRFPLEQHRRRFIVRRAMRRVLLANLNGMEPPEIQFDSLQNGKPRLSGINTPLEFNSSHSGDRGIIVTGKCQLGIDLEILDRPMDHLRFARRSFTKEEYDDIWRSDENELRIAFFNCWTGKEAYLKAIGRGLSKPLRSFAVRCAPNEAPGLRWDEERYESRNEYSFFRFTDGEYVATAVWNLPAGIVEPAFHELSVASIDGFEMIESDTRPKWQEC